MNIFDLAKARILVGGGGCDHSMEDGLIQGTLEHYVNDRVTSIFVYKETGMSSFEGTKAFLKGVSMEKIEDIPANAFYMYWYLENIDFPNAKEVGHNAFEDCPLINVNLPMVTKIGYSAFRSCDTLTRIVLPNATTFEDQVFYFSNWDNPVVIDLPKATMFGSDPFPTYTNAHVLLRNGTVANGVGNIDENGEFEGYVYVPRALVDSYKTAGYWSIFANRIRALEDYTVDGTITGELDMSKI